MFHKETVRRIHRVDLNEGNRDYFAADAATLIKFKTAKFL